MECVNCCNCIDACNSVMKKVGRDPGLIRYASQDQIEGKSDRIRFTPRLKAYGTLLAVLSSVLFILLLVRNPVSAEAIRAPGSQYQVFPDGSVMNIYQVRGMNKTGKETTGTLELLNVEGDLRYGNQRLTLPPQEQMKTIMVLTLPADQITGEKTRVKLGYKVDGKIIDTFRLEFPGPK
jgi:polyferredoxin